MIHEFIRLTAVSFSSDNCQTKEQQLPGRKFNNCQTNKSIYDEY